MQQAQRKDRIGAGYWWGWERTSRCAARCCLDVAKHKPANHHHLFPKKSLSFHVCIYIFFFFRFHSVCRPLFFLPIHIRMLRRPESDGIPSLSPTHNTTADKLFSFRNVSFVRVYDHKTDDLSVVTCHFGYFKPRQHTNTHIHGWLPGPSTHLLSLSLCWEWHFEKWWKMDLCPACNVEERHILSPKSHHRHTHFHMLHNTSFVEIESLHFILYHQVTVPTFLRTYHLASHWVRLEWLIGAKSPKSRNCSTFLCYPIEWSLVRLRAFITYAKKVTLRNLKK